MYEEQQEPLGYEEALRVIGRHLDTEPAYHFSLREGPDGFTVRYQPTSYLSETRVVEYTWERLQDLVIFHSSGRGSVRKRGRYHGLWAKFPNGHQGFFRALGFRLDQEGGHDIVVDERDDGVLLSYSANGGTTRSEITFSEAEIRSILEDAEQRRNPDAGLVPS